MLLEVTQYFVFCARLNMNIGTITDILHSDLQHLTILYIKYFLKIRLP